MVKRSFTPIDAANLAGLALILYLTVLLAQTIYTNYKLNRAADEVRAEIGVLKARQDQLKYNIQYYNTEAFREREARSRLNLRLPGENVLVLPGTASGEEPTVEEAPAAKPRTNFQQWRDFLSGKG